MRSRNLLILVVTAALLLLVACGGEQTKTKTKDENAPNESASTEGFNATGMPIVNDTISLEFFVRKTPGTTENWNDVMIWNEYEKMTNIDIKWEQIPNEGLEEKRNLVLASGNLPDAFYSSTMPTLDLMKYGEQGVFIALNDLIDKHAPNLKKIFEQYPEVEKGLTFPDGNIYSFPTIYSPDFTSFLIGARPWINQKWLDQLGMDMPETTDEFYNYLKAVKETDLNGNGKADEIPYGGTSIDGLIDWLKGSYGLGNRGNRHSYIDMDPKGEQLRFIPISDEYKEMLQFVNKLYSEGLIEKNIYTIEHNQYLANGAEGIYGSTNYYSPDILFGEKGKDLVGAMPLAGPYGDQMYTGVYSTLGRIDGFIITSANEHPEATVRWMDYFYSDEGAKLFFMGIEGETYEETPDGELKFLEKITNSSDGLTFEQELSKYLTYPNGAYPGIVKEEYFEGSESAPSSLEAAEKLKPYIVEERWPSFTYTVEENNKMASLSYDIETYVKEMRDRFITGDISFSEWDGYVNTINNMGLEDYMDIQNAAYERYKNN